MSASPRVTTITDARKPLDVARAEAKQHAATAADNAKRGSYWAARVASTVLREVEWEALRDRVESIPEWRELARHCPDLLGQMVVEALERGRK